MSRKRFLFPTRSRWWWVTWAGLLLLLALACQVSLGPEGLLVNTSPEGATATPAGAAQVPFDFSGAPPIVRPTPVVRGTPPAGATATPGGRAGGQSQGRGALSGPTVFSEIWDFPTGAYARGQSGVYYAAGGDVYAFNLYERPFSEQSQDTFYPDLDIRYARLVRMGDWFFASLRLHGLPQGGTAPAGDYGVELDTDLDGRGEYLVWATGPVPNAWTPTGVQVFKDQRQDVEGPRTCTSDAPLRGDGYDQVRYTADATTGLAWLMWGWETEGGKQYPTVYIAFHRSLLDGQDEQMLWLAWADAGLRQPGQMTYHDRYTRPEAGSPYRGDPNFPIRAIARVDNTCRAAFGFEPSGLEPCLCETSTTVSLCPAPQDAPAEGCVPDGPDTWACPFVPEGAAVPATGVLAAPAPSPDDLQLPAEYYCTWDPELCRWSCRTERICLPPSADDAVNQVPRLPFDQPPPGGSSGSNGSQMCYIMPDGMRCLDDQGNVTTGPPKLPFGDDAPPAMLPGLTGEIPSVQLPGPGGWVVGSGENQRLCSWDPNLCRWQCRDEQCVLPDPGPNCEAQPDGSYKCTTGGEISITTICRADQETCRWDCRPEGQVCPAPDGGPSSVCQDLGDGRWSCASEIGAYVCRWDSELCEWRCESDQCQIPNQECTLNQATERWVCPGKGEFQGCEWSVAECRWKCWNPIQPKPSEEPSEEPQCQPEDYCSLDEVWYCDDGNAYNSCEYDGCRWHCE